MYLRRSHMLMGFLAMRTSVDIMINLVESFLRRVLVEVASTLIWVVQMISLRSSLVEETHLPLSSAMMMALVDLAVCSGWVEEIPEDQEDKRKVEAHLGAWATSLVVEAVVALPRSHQAALAAVEWVNQYHNQQCLKMAGKRQLRRKQLRTEMGTKRPK